jgi:hypothetical protein
MIPCADKNRCAWKGDLNRCICRSRRRVGRCEFSARLFRHALRTGRRRQPVHDQGGGSWRALRRRWPGRRRGYRMPRQRGRSSGAAATGNACGLSGGEEIAPRDRPQCADPAAGHGDFRSIAGGRKGPSRRKGGPAAFLHMTGRPWGRFFLPAEDADEAL